MGSQTITRFYGCQLTSTNSAKQHKLRKLIAELSSKQAGGKEYVSLYIPKQAALDAVIEDLKKQDTDCNSVSKEENRRREEAIKNVIKHLKTQKQTPENGQALFAGNYADNTGNEVFNIEELTPPAPITQYLATIDNHFILEPLRDMLRDQRITGLILLDAKEAHLSILIGGNLQPIRKLTSGVPGKTGKGGQSQRRYERGRDMELTNWFHRIAEHAANEFLDNRQITTLVIGGPGQTKNDFLKGDYLNYQLMKLLIKTVDTQSVGNQATLEMLDKSADTLVNMCGPEERNTMQKLEIETYKQNGLVVFGLDPVLESLKQGTAEIAILTDNSGLYQALFTCRKCGLPKSAVFEKKNLAATQKMAATPCTRCQAIDYERGEKDMVDVLEDAAAQTNARVEVIFTDSEEKLRLKSLGGFAALLRYR